VLDQLYKQLQQGGKLDSLQKTVAGELAST
jgi:hypothetical protein